ncbi:hypothetical protein [Paraburkholderia caledonica]|uniref:hypothetical protein n=1 Tax=Paraburkholderia caledonica TaxID=134536 RepID=UPI001FC88448|nr:hypothetical protein [Paraburkholderia caledonica]
MDTAEIHAPRAIRRFEKAYARGKAFGFCAMHGFKRRISLFPFYNFSLVQGCCEVSPRTARRLTPTQASHARADNKQVTIHFEGAFPIYRLSWFQLRALLFSFLNAWSLVLSRDWQRSVRRQLSPVTSLARAQLRPRTPRSWRRCHWRR